MIVDLYQSATDADKFLTVPPGADPAALMVPDRLDKDYAELVWYREALEFDLVES